MKPFEYLSAFLVLFQVVTMSELTLGLAYALNGWSNTQFYPLHSLVVFIGYIGTMDIVIRMFYFKKIKVWNFWKFALGIVPGVCLLMIAKLLFPEIDPPESYDFEQVFLRNRSFIFHLTSLYLILISMPYVILFKTKTWIQNYVLWIMAILYIVTNYAEAQWLDYSSLVCGIIIIISMNLIRPPKLKEESR
ncbi:hypothetical protein [Reichenbachiella sp.]|uniref:hypothetical protein n=1 Tax=Reichenbachiella sp. TaxID=2184521 RepID=UPI003B59CDF2